MRTLMKVLFLWFVAGFVLSLVRPAIKEQGVEEYTLQNYSQLTSYYKANPSEWVKYVALCRANTKSPTCDYYRSVQQQSATEPQGF